MNPTYYMQGLLRQGSAVLARAYLGVTGGGGGIPEAPIDGGYYTRRNAGWSTLPNASAGNSGVLSAADWTTFNAKQNALTFGNLVESDSAVLTISGGTGAVVGAGVSIAVSKATAGSDGYLTAADWNTFNGKQAAGSYLTDAPNDGTTYARKNAAWSAVVSVTDILATQVFS